MADCSVQIKNQVWYLLKAGFQAADLLFKLQPSSLVLSELNIALRAVREEFGWSEEGLRAEYAREEAMRKEVR